MTRILVHEPAGNTSPSNNNTELYLACVFAGSTNEWWRQGLEIRRKWEIRYFHRLSWPWFWLCVHLSCVASLSNHGSASVRRPLPWWFITFPLWPSASASLAPVLAHFSSSHHQCSTHLLCHLGKWFPKLILIPSVIYVASSLYILSCNLTTHFLVYLCL